MYRVSGLPYFLIKASMPGPPEVNVFSECCPGFVRLQCALYVEGYSAFFADRLLLVSRLWCVGKHGVVHGSTLSHWSPLRRRYSFFLFVPSLRRGTRAQKKGGRPTWVCPPFPALAVKAKEPAQAGSFYCLLDCYPKTIQ